MLKSKNIPPTPPHPRGKRNASTQKKAIVPKTIVKNSSPPK